MKRIKISPKLSASVATLALLVASLAASPVANAVTTEMAANSSRAYANVTNPPSESRSTAVWSDSYSYRTCDTGWKKSSTTCAFYYRGYSWYNSQAGWQYR